jgi:hypothetical protein
MHPGDAEGDAGRALAGRLRGDVVRREPQVVAVAFQREQWVVLAAQPVTFTLAVVQN